jgi:methionyl-tRNA synthetase
MSTITFTTPLVVAVTAAVVVDLVLRGMALWRSARKGDNVWFVILLVINTVGILPLIYLLFFSKPAKKTAKK